MKKRLFSLILVLALCMGLTISASASLENDYIIVTLPELDYPEPGKPNGPLASLTDKSGKVIIPMKYSTLSFIEGTDALLAGNKTGPNTYKYGIIDINQTVLVPLQYTLIQKMRSGKNSKYLVIEDANTFLHGVLGPDFSVIVPTKYYEVDLLSEEDGYFLVASPDGQTLYPNTWGVNSYTRHGGKCGVCNKNGTLFIPCEYDLIEYLGEGFFAVRKNNLEGVYDSQGRVVLPLEYAEAESPIYTGINRCRDTFTVRKYVSEEYRQRAAAGEAAPDTGELWTTAGVVDANNNVLIDFGKYQAIRFTESTSTFTCARWTGGYKAD